MRRMTRVPRFSGTTAQPHGGTSSILRRASATRLALLIVGVVAATVGCGLADAQPPEVGADPPPAVVEGTEPGTEHPLEQVIDDSVTVGESRFRLDEAAALACANVEFALDALVAGDVAALDSALDEADRWASETDAVGITQFLTDLRGRHTLAEAEPLVFEILGVCADAGYEL